MIARRTDLVQDPDALAALDIALAERAVAWGPISDRKLEKAIDVWVIAADPDAVRRTSSTARDREFSVGDPYDHDGITTVWGRLLATDAKLLDARLTAMAAIGVRRRPAHPGPAPRRRPGRAWRRQRPPDVRVRCPGLSRPPPTTGEHRVS